MSIAILLLNGAAAQTIVSVDPHSVFQRFEGWGTSLCWWANMAGRFSPATRSKLTQDLFTLNDGGLGFNVVRFNIGGGENPAIPNTMEPRARMEGYWPGPDQRYDWTADQTQRAVLSDAIAAARVAGLPLSYEVFSNSPPWWMTISGSVTGNTGADGKPAENLRPDQYENFAAYLLEVTRFLENMYGIQVDSISPFNEPTSDWWKYGGRQEGCFFTRASMARLISILHAKFGDTSYKLAAPEDWSFPQSIASWDSWSGDIHSAIDRINTHAYSGADRSALAARAERSGRKIRMSEYGDGDGTGRTLAAGILEDLKYLEASSWVNWQAVSPDNWGMLGNDYVSEAYTRATKFYVMAHFSRFVRPGYQILGVDDANSLAAYDPADGTLILVVTNFGDSPALVEFDLSRFKELGESAEWYQTEVLAAAGDHLTDKGAVRLNGKLLNLQLAPQSISTVSIQAGPASRDESFAGSGIYSLRNVSTGLYLTVDGTAPAAAGSAFTLASRDAGALQRFRIDAVAPGWFRLVNRYSGYDLNVRGASNSPGAQIIQWLETAIAVTPRNSQWAFEWNTDGTCRIQARQSGLYLDAAN